MVKFVFLLVLVMVISQVTGEYFATRSHAGKKRAYICSDYSNQHCRMQEPAVCDEQRRDGGGFCLIALDWWGNWIKCNKNADCKDAAENWGNCAFLRGCTHVLVSGDGHVTDGVDPIIATSLKEAMSTKQQQHDQEMKSIRDALVTQQLQHDAEITSLKQELMNLHDVMIEQETMVTKQQHDAELTSLKYEMTINQAKYNEDSTLGPVWFSAMKTDGLVFTEPSNGPLIFPDNIASMGTGFDPVTSIFTAPVPGLYFFTATLRQNVDDMIFYLKWYSGTDDDIAYLRQGMLDDATSYNTATINAIVHLQRGDTINVYVSQGNSLVCLECNFDGYLLHRHK